VALDLRAHRRRLVEDMGLMRAASVVWLGFVFTVGPGLSGLATQPITVQRESPARMALG
jgi:hypothetical protein